MATLCQIIFYNHNNRYIFKHIGDYKFEEERGRDTHIRWKL